MKIGKKLRLLRKEKRLTLKQLSEKSGVAIATLSRIEHNIMTGTILSHVNVCKALEISLSDFYQEIESASKNISLIKNKPKPSAHVSAKKIAIELLTTNISSKKMMPTLLRIAKGSQTQLEKNKPSTEKFVYLIAGHLTAKVGNETHLLKKGDSLYFDASLPHSLSNHDPHDAEALCLTCPPVI